MSQTPSLFTGLKYGVEMVCKAWNFPRSSFYQAEKHKPTKSKQGRPPKTSDEALLRAIQQDIAESHFRGEGHRKVHARLKRFKHMKIGRNRILRLMRENKLLSPYRAPPGKEWSHDGRITTDKPNEMWGTDAAKIFTLEDGWVWFFGVIEHWNAECLGWHLTKKGNRFAAIEPLTQAVEKVFGSISCGIARGLQLRTDHGSQFISEGYMNQVRYWGMAISKGFVGEPETNGVEERFHRTFKEQIIYGRQYHSLEDLRAAVAAFIALYNEHWLLEKLGYRSPMEARKEYLEDQKGVQPSEAISSALAEQEEGARLLCSDR